MTDRTGVLVMAHGTPQRTADIAPFYTRIRGGRPPSPEQLADLERRYAAIGGLSPLTERTEAQVDAVRAELERRAPGHYVVAYGAKHTEPLIEEAAAALAACGCRRDHRPGADAARLLAGLRGVPDAGAGCAGRATVPFVAVPPWYGEPDLVTLLADRVREALERIGAGHDIVGGDTGPGDQSRYPVIFTAHSLPERVRDMGDTYPEQLQESAALVAAAAGLVRWQVAWQSAGTDARALARPRHP